MKRPLAFITGIAGFAGSWLAEELLANGYDIAGALMPGESTDNISHIQDQLKLVKLDICDAAKSRRTIQKIKPDYIFHLAAVSSVGQSFSMERLTYRVNFEGTLNILEAARDLKRLHKMVFISSTDCYGLFTPKNKTLTEDQPFNPNSPYALSKAATEYLCLYHQRRFGVPVAIARAFNHSGPRQNDSFVIPSFCKQIARIEAKRQKAILKVGDLSARRDLSDVRDVVRGYRLLAMNGQSGRAYHICSERAVAIRTVLNSLLKMSKLPIKVMTDKSRLRKSDLPCLRGSLARSRRELKYEPQYSLTTTLKDSLDYWRTVVIGKHG